MSSFLRTSFKCAILGIGFAALSIGAQQFEIGDITIPNPLAAQDAEAATPCTRHSLNPACRAPTQPVSKATPTDINASTNDNLAQAAKDAALQNSTDMYYAQTTQGRFQNLKNVTDNLRIKEANTRIGINAGIFERIFQLRLPGRISSGAATVSDRLGRIASIETQMLDRMNSRTMKACYETGAQRSRQQYNIRTHSHAVHNKLKQLRQSIYDNDDQIVQTVDLNDIAIGMQVYELKSGEIALSLIGRDGTAKLVKGDAMIATAIATAMDVNMAHSIAIHNAMTKACQAGKIGVGDVLDTVIVRPRIHQPSKW